MRSRYSERGVRYVAVGFDGRGRELEMIGTWLESGDWLVYHAMTPPTDKTYAELGMIGGRG